MDFYDLDAQIEEQVDMPISEVFERFGEGFFREVEKNVLHETAKLDKGIISTGGGAPCFFDNVEWMNQQGLTVYLQTDAQLLATRLESEMAHRPLLAHLSRAELIDFIEKKVASRASFYEQAQLIWVQDQANQSDWSVLGEKIRARLFDPGKI